MYQTAPPTIMPPRLNNSKLNWAMASVGMTKEVTDGIALEEVDCLELVVEGGV